MFTADWSFLDPMTAILNKKCAWPRFETALSDSRNTKTPFSILLIDIDHLKQFCDNRSHASGDKAIRIVANVLSELWTQREVPCRYGGEEFAFMLLGHGELESHAVAEKIRTRVEGKIFPDFQTSLPSHVTVSIGVACTSEGNDSFSKILRRADEALNKAKNSGRNCVVVG